MKVRHATVALVLALAVLGCPDPSPRLLVSLDAATFNALAGGIDPAPRSVEISNGGGGSLNGLQRVISYAAGQPNGWLTATLNGTSAPATLSIQATPSALAPGTYTATITVSASRASDDPVALNVTLNLAPGGVIAGLQSAAAHFPHTQGLPDPSTTFEITNTGAGALRDLNAVVSYPTGTATGWLSATLSTTSAPATLVLHVVSSAIAPNSYAATVTVTSPYATNGPQTIPVTLNLAAGAVDLVVSTPDTLILPASIQAGQQLDLPAWAVLNVGTLPSPSVRVGVYLSTDADFTPSDFQLVGIQTLPLPAGGGRGTGARSVGIPTALAAGEYWIGIVADMNGESAESDETNNVRKSKITVTAAPADLTIVAPNGMVMTPNLATRGAIITFPALTVVNQGPGRAEFAQAGFYWSADSVITASDRFIIQLLGPGLNSGETMDASGMNVAVPFDLADGDYFLGVLVDHLNAVPESDETNNYISARVTISSSSVAGKGPTPRPVTTRVK